MNKQPKLYLQTDPRWKNKDYSARGEHTTIGASGCGPTSAAMIIETLTGKTYTPEDACKWSLEHGYKAVKHGTYYAYFVPQFAAMGISCHQLNWNSVYHKPTANVHDTAFDLLKQGYYLIALMKAGNWTKGGHFVVVWEKDNKVHINDPYSTKPNRVLGDIKTFRNEAAYYWAINATDYNKNKIKEEDTMAVYKHLQDVPKSYQPTIKKLMEKKVLVGYKDPDPKRLDDNIIDVSEDFCRVMTTLDRLGKLI